jgi:hypothetical protein
VRNCIAALKTNKKTYAFLSKLLNHNFLKKLSAAQKGAYITAIQELPASLTESLRLKNH